MHERVVEIHAYMQLLCICSTCALEDCAALVLLCGGLRGYPAYTLVVGACDTGLHPMLARCLTP